MSKKNIYKNIKQGLIEKGTNILYWANYPTPLKFIGPKIERPLPLQVQKAKHIWNIFKYIKIQKIKLSENFINYTNFVLISHIFLIIIIKIWNV